MQRRVPCKHALYVRVPSTAKHGDGRLTPTFKLSVKLDGNDANRIIHHGNFVGGHRFKESRNPRKNPAN